MSNPFDISPLKHRRPFIRWGHEEIKSNSKAFPVYEVRVTKSIRTILDLLERGEVPLATLRQRYVRVYGEG